jgi:hypothetical protein
MTNGENAGFWSYAHSDNQSSNGRLLALADEIRKEYDILTGDSLHLFMDRDDVEWGDAWRERLDTNLTATTFFIALITPRYLQSPECRKEFIQFTSKAQNLGIAEYLLPILYAPIPELGEDHPDEIAAMVARTQYEDWRQLRLNDPNSEPHRIAVNRLVARLIDIDKRMTQVQMEAMQSAEDDVTSEGLKELTEEIHKLFSPWHEAVIISRTLEAQESATFTTFQERIQTLESRKSPQSALTTTTIRFGEEIFPITKRYNETAQEYSSLTIQLDPLIRRSLELIAVHGSGIELLMEVAEGIHDAMDCIRDIMKMSHLRAQGSKAITKVKFYGQNKNLSRTFRELERLERQSVRLVTEGNNIVIGWHQELSAITG